MRLRDPVLALSQRINLGLFAVAAAFGAARDLKKIRTSGFEMIGIGQCESLGPLDFPHAFASASTPTEST